MSESLARSPAAASAPTARVSLRAGPLTMICEGGDLRYIKLGEQEIIRRIHAAVRDRNWGTVPGRISDLQASVASDHFRISYLSIHQRDEIHFVWRAEITGQADGTIRFTFDGEARTTFLRNRIGFCVLHPADCAGMRCLVERGAGPPVEVMFPRLVEATQPVPGIHDLAALSHEVAPGVWAELRFDGERFEMEDQRNWIDASFKTFCTPLHLPYPVEVPALTRIRQRIFLKLIARRPLPAVTAEVRSPLRIALTGVRRPLPTIGIGSASHGQPLTAGEAARLGALRFAHLRAEVRLDQAGWLEMLTRSQQQSAQLRVPLELAVHLPAQGGERELDELGHQLRAGPAAVARVLLFRAGEKTPSAASLALARTRLTSLGVPIGAGTDADFYQLNQCRPSHEQADFVHWSMNPQVHAFDLPSIAETPTAVAAQLESAREFFPNKPLVVSPVTFKPRFNPVATAREKPPAPDELPPPVDSRQVSPFVAAWTLAMIKHLAEQGAASVTFFETTGWRGVMERESGSPLPSRFLSQPGQIFPVYYALGALGAFAGGEVILTHSSDPLRVESIALANKDSTCLWLANLTAIRQTAVVAGFTRVTHRLDLDFPPGGRWQFEPDSILRSVGRELVPAAEHELPIELAPHGLVRLELQP
ncbi:MAG: hypothetical protein ABMA26_00680 [Limisphaerales bacterium]